MFIIYRLIRKKNDDEIYCSCLNHKVFKLKFLIIVKYVIDDNLSRIPSTFLSVKYFLRTYRVVHLTLRYHCMMYGLFKMITRTVHFCNNQ